MKPFGMKAHEFGTAIITNVGTLGVKDGYAPFPPFAHVPIIACVGMIDKEPRVIDDEVRKGRSLDRDQRYNENKPDH